MCDVSIVPVATLLPPTMVFRPLICVRVTVLVSPGSNRADVPDGISRW